MAAEPSHEDDRIFEEEVQRFARLLYPGNDERGAIIIDGLERDGVFITDDLAIAIEATRSEKKYKAEKDGAKLTDLTRKLGRKYPDKAVRGFFITEKDPSAHQRAALAKFAPQVAAMSFATFQAKLVDAKSYLQDRKRYPFGSALDPVTQSPDIQDPYIPIGLTELPAKVNSFTVDAVISLLKQGRSIVLLGDFGAGKSMTMREIFLRCSRELIAGGTSIFPLYLNLRDHQGQTDPAEALHRHATSVGFPSPHQLVRAWRSGRVVLMLDGFDEISSSNWPGSIDSLREVRRRSVALVRNFSQQNPPGTGFMVAGRPHFFDDHDEMAMALGLKADALLLSASDLTMEQVRQMMSSRDARAEFPAWLPPRPLLVAHLTSRDLFDGLGTATRDVEPAEGWDFLIDVISERESRLGIGVDGQAVRIVLERLASHARSTASGLGPLGFDEILSAFQTVCGYTPDTESFVLVQRLAGLQVYEAATNRRIFVDDDLVDVLRVGDIVRFIESPYGTHEYFDDMQTLLGDLGMAVLDHLINKRSIAVGSIKTALQRTSSSDERMQAVSADLIRLLLHLGEDVETSATLRSLVVPSLEVSDGAIGSNVVLSDCIIQELDVTGVSDVSILPFMRKCVIETITGVAGIDDLAQDHFEECSIGAFSDSAENTSAILSLPLSDFKTVMLLILQKLFKRSGKGRRELAFYRGGLTDSQRMLVPTALGRLQSEGVAWKGRSRGTVLWSPNRAMGNRVLQILKAPMQSADRLLDEP